MAIHCIDTRGRQGRRIAWLAAAAAICAVLHAVSISFDPMPAADPALSRGNASRCCGKDARLPQTGTPRGSTSIAASPPAIASQHGVADGAQLYQQALLYLGCEALATADANGEQTPSDQLYQFDASGALAARIEREARARRAPCRLLGPHEYRQADALMRQAAQQGDRDAVFFLLQRDVQAAVERAATARAQGQPVDNHALADALVEVQAMARDGQRDAMVLAGQLMAAGQAGPPDPVGAASWNLVALEIDKDRPLSPGDLDDSGVLSSLTADEATLALQQAESLHRVCCEQGRPTGTR